MPLTPKPLETTTTIDSSWLFSKISGMDRECPGNSILSVNSFTLLFLCRLDIQDLTTKCASLLRDHSHLLPAFNKFLPEGWSVISPAPAGILASSSSILSRREATRSRSSADADYARASAERRSLQFLTKVKIRFNGGETYANFVNALRLSSNDAEGLSQVSVSYLFIEFSTTQTTYYSWMRR